MFSFRLPTDFIETYKDKPVDWGFKDAGGNSLGEITFLRTYSRIKEDGTKEQWWEVCQRVIEGMMSIQKDHCRQNRLPWRADKAQRTAQDAYDRMFNFKWLPPGRGLWMMGTSLVMEHRNSAALQNCSYISSEDITRADPSSPFTFLMEASMLGIGVGFDTLGSKKRLRIYEPSLTEYEVYQVPDTREGWVESVKKLLESYLMPNKPLLYLDTSKVRPAGDLIKTFGGTSAGPAPLERLHEKLHELFTARLEEGEVSELDVELIADIGNLIGVCVVSGNVRRSAELLLGEVTDENFHNLKNPDIYPARNKYSEDPGKSGWGWISNNSVLAEVGQDLSNLTEAISLNGEPGIVWMDVSRAYGRLIDPVNNKDHRAKGYNPCSEQTLESGECCTLVELFMNRHKDLKDFQQTAKLAFLYAKTVTLMATHWEKTNAIMQRNRRIGCSVSGVADFTDTNGMTKLRQWLDSTYATVQYYDEVYSEWLCVRESIKTTTVKPSGCRPWEALTTTDQGILTLEEIFTASGHSNNEVWHPFSGYSASQDGTSSRITKTYDNGKAEVFSVRMSYGMEVRSTGNHRWWVSRRYDRSKKTRWTTVNAWVRTDELQSGDVLEVIPGVYTSLTEAPLDRLDSRAISMRGDATEILQPVSMTPDIGWLLGYLWGDGAMSPGRYRLRFTDAIIENLEKAQRILLEVFGVKSSIHHKHGEGAFTLDIGSKMLWHWLIKNGVWKYFANDIDLIPEVVRRSSHETILAFLAGLIDADGHVAARSKENIIILGTASANFARHVQDVALSVGIVLGRSHNTKGENLQPEKSMWLMCLGPDTVPERLNMMTGHSWKMSNPRHPELPWSPHRRRTSCNTIFGKVTAVESMGEMDTFDIEVEDTHWYYAGAVKSHNTVSILAGSSPGAHWGPGGAYFNRAVRFAKDDPMVFLFKHSGYKVEVDVSNPETTVVVYFPIKSQAKRSQQDVSLFEKANLAVLLQRYWSDNSVSVTLTFDPETEKEHVGTILKMYDGSLKTVSFLPSGNKVYPQMPYTHISEEDFEAAEFELMPVDLSGIYQGLGLEAIGESFCQTDTCLIKEFEENVKTHEQ